MPGRALAASLCSVALAGWGAAAASTVAVVAGDHRIEAEVADTADSRATGLMYRTAMPADHGMLFVFPGDGNHCMWMRNTYLPLSVAFLDNQARVINVAEMVPQTDTSHCAPRPARYALEMHGGWFAQHGIVVGTRLQFRVGPASW